MVPPGQPSSPKEGWFSRGIVSGCDGVAGRASPQAFHFVKSIDKASPKLFAASCGGASPGVATFASRKAGEGQKDFLKITMKEVIISSVSLSGDGGEVPSETLSLRFASADVQVEGAADAPACVPPRNPGRDHFGG